MVSSASTRDDSQERKSFLDKPNSSKTTKTADASEKNSKNERSEKSKDETNKSEEPQKSSKTAKSAKSVKSGKSTKSLLKSGRSEKSAKTATTKSAKSGKSQSSKKSDAAISTTSVQSVGRRGPKMSDGTEFDTGPFGYVFSFIYLAVLWGLAIMAAIAITYFNYSRLDPQFPTYFGEGSFLGGVPRVTFDPNPRRFLEETTRNMMAWNIHDFKSYVNLLIRYKHVLKNYASDEKSTKEKKERQLCRNQTMTTKEACRFDRFTDFGDCVLSKESLEHGFGFSKGQPCIMLKINKIVGWVPKLQNQKECPPGDLCCGEGIKFQCESNDDVQFEYYPKNGISACYFPYANQEGYEQPYQMVKVTNLTFDKETTIACHPTDPSLREIIDGKRNDARFHIKMTRRSPESPK